MNPTPILAALLALPPVFSGAHAALSGANETAPADSVLRVYDLRALGHGFDADSWEKHLAVTPAQFEQRGLRVESSDAGGETVVELLQQLLGDDLRFEGRRYTLEGDELYVNAPEETHAQIRATLDVLEGRLAAQTALRVDVMSWPSNGAPELPGLSLPAATVDSFLQQPAEGVRVETFRPRLRVGRTTVIDHMRTQSFTYDHDVEIAQAAGIYDPIIELVESGVRMLLRGSPRAGGLQLALVFQSAELVELRRKNLRQYGVITGTEKVAFQPLEGPKLIESPEVIHSSVAFSTFVTQGEVLAFSTRSAELDGGRSQLVFLRLEGGLPPVGATHAVPGVERRLVLLDSGALQGPTFRVKGPLYEDYYPYQPLVWARFDAEPSSFLFEAARQLFPGRRRIGPWAVAVTDADPQVLARAAELTGEARPQADLIDLELLLRARPGAKPLASVRLPVVSGSAVAAMMGLSTTRIVDHDVEVAQGAAISDPSVRPVFSGLACALHPRTTDDGARVDADAVGHVVDPAVEGVDLGTSGIVERVTSTRVRIDERVELSTSQPRAIFGAGDGPHMELLIRAAQ